MNTEADASTETRPSLGDRLTEAVLTFVLGAGIRVCEAIGVERSLRCGEALGFGWRAVGAPRTRRVREQLAAAFPEASASQRERWHAEVFTHLGLGLAELLLLLGRHRPRLLERMRVEGLEHLERARTEAEGRGVIVIGPHLGNWELAAARFGSLGVPIAVVHRARRQRVLDRALRRVRNVHEREGAAPDARLPEAVQSIALGPRAGFQFVRALGAGRSVLVLLDQRARRGEGLVVPFFGRPAETRSAPLKLADRLGAPVLIACARRDPDRRGHRLLITAPLQLEAGASDDEEVLRRNLERVTAALESEIRASPGQWIWTHRRWRIRPDAERPN